MFWIKNDISINKIKSLMYIYISFRNAKAKVSSFDIDLSCF